MVGFDNEEISLLEIEDDMVQPLERRKEVSVTQLFLQVMAVTTLACIVFSPKELEPRKDVAGAFAGHQSVMNHTLSKALVDGMIVSRGPEHWRDVEIFEQWQVGLIGLRANSNVNFSHLAPILPVLLHLLHLQHLFQSPQMLLCLHNLILDFSLRRNFIPHSQH